MALLRCLMTAAAFLASGCGSKVSGVVQDAATDLPIAGAQLELSDNGWGFRNKQLVWDAEKISRATTDTNGRFTFDAAGGSGLRVATSDHQAVSTSLCPASPTTVR